MKDLEAILFETTTVKGITATWPLYPESFDEKRKSLGMSPKEAIQAYYETKHNTQMVAELEGLVNKPGGTHDSCYYDALELINRYKEGK